MSREELSKRSGWAFILGSFSFATILSGSDPLAIPGSVISSILLAIGMSGLRARYGERAGSFGRTILLFGAGGPGLLVIFIAMGLCGIVTVAQVEEGLWILLFIAPAVPLLGLTLFGLTALRSKPMPRLNWLTAFAGIWYPAFYFFLAGYLFTHNGEYPGQYQTAFNIMFLIQFLALCTFGTALLKDAPQEMAAA